MTQKTTAQVSVHEMLAEAQNYRTSLESLMTVGRALLANPSMEDDSATGFKVLAENVLETADHQGDLAAVDGVQEGAAVVELIMQDVLTPRLTEVEEIERALQAKAENEAPVPFTTQHRETAASMEAAFRCEVLELMKENVGNVKAMISMEAMPLDITRPMVISLAQRVGEQTLGISLEELGQTQVIGELADAVERIEALVTKAHESAIEASEQERQQSEAISQGEDRMGDFIESHREEGASGAQLDEGTPVTSVQSETDPAVNLDQGADDLGIGSDTVDETAGTDATAGESETTDETTGDDTANTVDDADNAETQNGGEVTEETTEEEEEENGADANTSESESEENKDDSEEEEESEDDVSTESNVEPVEIDNLANCVDNFEARRDVVAALLDCCCGHGLLTDKGQQAMQAGVGTTTVITSDMFTPACADVLVKHYDMWAGASIRDGGPNLRAICALMGV